MQPRHGDDGRSGRPARVDRSPTVTRRGSLDVTTLARRHRNPLLHKRFRRTESSHIMGTPDAATLAAKEAGLAAIQRRKAELISRAQTMLETRRAAGAEQLDQADSIRFRALKSDIDAAEADERDMTEAVNEYRSELESCRRNPRESSAGGRHPRRRRSERPLGTRGHRAGVAGDGPRRRTPSRRQRRVGDPGAGRARGRRDGRPVRLSTCSSTGHRASRTRLSITSKACGRTSLPRWRTVSSSPRAR